MITAAVRSMTNISLLVLVSRDVIASSIPENVRRTPRTLNG